MRFNNILSVSKTNDFTRDKKSDFCKLMIICVSANPALDRRIRLKKLNIGEVNRVESSISFAGGKSAHVAIVAKTLGESVTWIGFLGGVIGDKIERQLTDLGIKVIPIRTISETRINDEIIDENGVITEILDIGGTIQPNEINEMFAVCEKIFAQHSNNFQAVFSGSLPLNISTDFYFEMTQIARKFGGKVLLDSSGEALLKGLEAQPDFIKPNRNEAENISGIKITDNDSAIKTAQFFQSKGAKNVVLSLGADGIIWLKENSEMLMAKPPQVQVNSTVGCGDATGAAFAVADSRNLDSIETLKLAIACGAANCLAELPAQIKLDDVELLKEKVEFID